MTTRLYECLFLLDPAKATADPEAAQQNLHHLLERHGAEIVISRPWDENRKLAYPIRRQNQTHKKGYFYIIYYRMLPKNQIPLEADLRINELVIRHLTSVIDPKWEDTMLDVARNDPGASFAIRGMQEEPVGSDVTPNFGMGDDGEQLPPPPPRRSRREFSEKPE